VDKRDALEGDCRKGEGAGLISYEGNEKIMWEQKKRFQ
jgi:hypothetical protein